jgi:hypothetical protein
LEQIFQDAAAFEATSQHNVVFGFHTYWGFLVYFVQQYHCESMPADRAIYVLRRLHRFNVTYGLFCPGAIFIPLLSWWHYHAELRNIRRQLVKQETEAAKGGEA